MCFCATANLLFGGSYQLPTMSELCLTIWFDYRVLSSSWKLEGTAEHLIDSSESAFVSSALNFGVCMLLKGAIKSFERARQTRFCTRNIHGYTVANMHHVLKASMVKCRSIPRSTSWSTSWSIIGRHLIAQQSVKCPSDLYQTKISGLLTEVSMEYRSRVLCIDRHLTLDACTCRTHNAWTVICTVHL